MQLHDASETVNRELGSDAMLAAMFAGIEKRQGDTGGCAVVTTCF
jgi:hypothetical protein